MKALFSTLLLTTLVAQTIPLKVAEVNYPRIPCITCSDIEIIVAGEPVTSQLQNDWEIALATTTRAVRCRQDSKVYYVYEYYLSLNKAANNLPSPCVESLTLKTGDVVNFFDFNGDGQRDEIYVANRAGSRATIGIASAEMRGDEITFTFASPICAGVNKGEGELSLPFGFVSTRPPVIDKTSFATVKNGATYNISARVPEISREH